MSYSGFEFWFMELFVETCKKAVWGAGGGAVVGGIVGSIILYVTRDIYFAMFYKTFWICVGIGIPIGIIIGIVTASSQYIHEKIEHASIMIRSNTLMKNASSRKEPG